MSNLYQRTLSLAGVDTSDLSLEDLRSLVREILATGIHGLCFSPYVEGQGPGTEVEAAQIRDRLQVIAPFIGWVRSFSAREGNESIPTLAKEQGLVFVARVDSAGAPGDAGALRSSAKASR